MTKLNLKPGTLKGAIVSVVSANYLIPAKLSLDFIADNYEELRWEEDFMESYEMQRDIERVVLMNSNF